MTLVIYVLKKFFYFFPLFLRRIAIGDHLFKLPVPYTTRVFSNAAAGFRISTPLQDIIPRIKTPPYVSSVPDVTHVALVQPQRDKSNTTTTTNRSTTTTARQQQRYFVILASDGLVELFHHSVDARVWVSYVREALVAGSASSQAVATPSSPVLGKAGPSSPGKAGKKEKERNERNPNPALALLRRGLGGESEEYVSRMLTVEMEERWMDDTSIVVLTL